MALLRKLFASLVLLFLLFFGTLVVFLVFQGKALVERKASAIFDRKVTIGGATYVFPLGLRLTELTIDGLLFVPEAQLTGGLGLLDARQWVLAKVTLENAVFTHHRADKETIDATNVPASSGPEHKTDHPGSLFDRAVLIRQLIATGGRIVYIDHSDRPLEIALVLHQLKASNVPLSGQNIKVPFSASGRIMDGETFSGPNELTAEGWLNWKRRDLNAKANISKWRNNMDVALDLSSSNNVMTVHGRMKSQPLTQQDNGSNGETASDAITAFLQKSALAMDMDFTFVTQMDRLELRNIDFSGNLSAPKEGDIGTSGK